LQYFDKSVEYNLSEYKQLRENIGLHSTGRKTYKKLECGPMPNVMAALLNIGGALCSTPQSLADAHYCSAVQ